MNRDPDAFPDINYLDVETDENGEVIAVWFRRQSLPFRQIKADKFRADDMKRFYEKEMPKIISIKQEDSES